MDDDASAHAPAEAEEAHAEQEWPPTASTPAAEATGEVGGEGAPAAAAKAALPLKWVVAACAVLLCLGVVLGSVGAALAGHKGINQGPAQGGVRVQASAGHDDAAPASEGTRDLAPSPLDKRASVVRAASAPPVKAAAGELAYADKACSGTYLSASARTLEDCLALLPSDCATPYVTHSAEYGFCFACTARGVSKRVAQPGYSIYGSGCAVRLAPPPPSPPPRRSPHPPSPSPRPPPSPSPRPPPPSPSPPPEFVPRTAYELVYSGHMCGRNRNIVSATARSPDECQDAVVRSLNDDDARLAYAYFAFSPTERLCLACDEHAVRSRRAVTDFDIFRGTFVSPPSPPSPPPNWAPRPPPSPSPSPPPPSPSPPAPRPPPVIDGVVVRGALCGAGGPSWGMHGSALQHPHFWGKATAEACAEAIEPEKWPWFSWSSTTHMCFGCDAPPRGSGRSDVHADARYDVYRTGTFRKGPSTHHHGGSLEVGGGDPLAAFKRGEELAKNPFILHMHPERNTHDTGGTGLHGLFGFGLRAERPAAGAEAAAATRGVRALARATPVVAVGALMALFGLALVGWRYRRHAARARRRAVPSPRPRGRAGAAAHNGGVPGEHHAGAAGLLL